MRNKNPIVFLGACLAFLGVLAGALGAHALEETLARTGHVKVWETAVLFHLFHALALFALGVWQDLRGRSKTLTATALCWFGGTLLFSGSLYLLSLGGPRFLGPVTPLGGLLFMGGWLALMVSSLRGKSREG